LSGDAKKDVLEGFSIKSLVIFTNLKREKWRFFHIYPLSKDFLSVEWFGKGRMGT